VGVTFDQIIHDVMLSRAQYLESVIVKLLAEGAKLDEIQDVQHIASSKTEIFVNGVCKCTWDLIYNGESYFK
jgi:hypothetical protein